MSNRWIVFAAAGVALLAIAAAGAAPAATTPKIDKPALENYLRYAEGFTPDVKFVIDEPSPSPFNGLYRLLVHLSAGTQKMDRLYYLSADGKRIVAGTVWDLNANPFQDVLDHLPAEGPAFGPPNAKVNIVIFSDFECPYCRELAKTIRENVSSKYPNDVRVMFKDFPLEAMHKWARAAAEGSHCIERQKPAAFWAFHDYIFEHQQEVDPGSVRNKVLDVAKQQGLDVLQVSSCMDSHATAGEVDKSQQIGQALQITRTPTLFINGRMVPSALPWDALETIIKTELNRPKATAATGTEKCCEVTIPTVGNH